MTQAESSRLCRIGVKLTVSPVSFCFWLIFSSLLSCLAHTRTPSCPMVHAQLLVKALVSSCLVGAASCFVVVTPRGVAPQRRCPSCFPSPLPPGQRGMGSRLRAKKKKSNSGRPSLDDVERLSRGQAAKKRGTGSRGVCHRLNESERKVRCAPHVHHVAVVFWFPSQFASPRCACVIRCCHL